MTTYTMDKNKLSVIKSRKGIPIIICSHCKEEIVEGDICESSGRLNKRIFHKKCRDSLYL